MSELEISTMRKVQWRFLPLLLICFIIGFMDRVNVGFAALTMSKELGFSATVFGLGAGLFFVTYFICEIPSNLALERFGARRWIARIMITWGIVSTLAAFVWSEWSFYGMRILLGAAEAGFFPGIVLFLTYWLPSRYRARATAIFMAAMPLASVVGAPISGFLVGISAFGLHGWQVMYIAEGVPAIILAFFVLKMLRDSPSDAEWLTDDERRWLKDRLAREEKMRVKVEAKSHLDVMLNGRLWLISAAYFGLVAINFGLSFFLPQIIRQFDLSYAQTGLVTAIPFLFAAIGMVVWGIHSDRTAERRIHLFLPTAIAIIGLAGSTIAGSSVLKLTLLCFACVGVFSALAIFFSTLPGMLHPAVAAVGLAMVNSLGNLAGFMAPFVIGSVKDATGSFNGGLQIFAAYGFVALLLMIALLRNRHPANVRKEIASSHARDY